MKGRTQHSVKNRFVCLLSKRLDLKREEVRKLEGQNLISIVKNLLKSMDNERKKMIAEQSNVHGDGIEKIQEKTDFPFRLRENDWETYYSLEGL